MVVQHMPGSGGLLVANRLYNAAPKDGTVVGMINRGIPFEPLLGGQGTQFDALKINYVGSPGRDTTVCAARKDAPVQNAAGPLQQGADASAAPARAPTPRSIRNFSSALLGMKFKLVKGYKGSHEIQLAMERNEVQGICLAYDSLLRGNLARQGQINILLQAAIEPDPRLKDVPLGLQAARIRRRSAQALELFFARASMGRPFVAPAEVPADRVAALRTAFEAMLRDPAFLDDARQAAAQRGGDHRRAADRNRRQRLQDAARDRAAHDEGAGPRRLARVMQVFARTRWFSLSEDFSLMLVTEALL